MLLVDLATLSARVAAASARTVKIGLLADTLSRLAGAEIGVGVAWLSGHLRQGRIGLGPALVRAAWKTAAAAEATLTVLEVDETFARIEETTGAGSTARRGGMLSALLSRATREEADFLARLVLGELRQGALAGLMEEAVARATGLPAVEVRRAAMLAGDLEAVARAALAEGREGLAGFRLETLRPIVPMLAQPAADLDEVFERLGGEAAWEWKLDGARVQVHRLDGEVRVFTRNLNEVTAAVPELVEAVAALPARELILDGEVVALRPDGSPQPFQVTMRRFGRRLDVERLRRDLPLTPFFFDLLRLDGRDLIFAPGHDRFAALRAAAGALAVPQIITADPAAARAFYDDALSRGHEGVMAKSLDAPYEAGRRGYAWLKVKREHTLDLVVLAVERGSGRRTGKLSNIHLGARDPETGQFVMLGKTFKGMTDEMLAWQTRRFQELATSDDGWVVRVRPEQVVEVTFNDVQESAQYPGGMALRFARVKRYRDDKTADEADTLDAVRALLPASERAS